VVFNYVGSPSMTVTLARLQNTIFIQTTGITAQNRGATAGNLNWTTTGIQWAGIATSFTIYCTIAGAITPVLMQVNANTFQIFGNQTGNNFAANVSVAILPFSVQFRASSVLV
jgi:hypothetical protein